jgi:hypothetical protein
VASAFPLDEHVRVACQHLKRVAMASHALLSAEWMTAERFAALYRKLFGIVSDPEVCLWLHFITCCLNRDSTSSDA